MNCEYCNKPIEEGHRPNKKFCNDKCRVYEFKFKKGLKPNPFEDKHIKYNSPDIIKLRKEIEKKIHSESKVGKVCEHVLFCINKGHYSKIKQSEINFIFTGNFFNEVFINLNF
ncbi:MAG: hypothetical protein RI883_2374 [Bacteroidota bacterium]|jgi:hypothetical protein